MSILEEEKQEVMDMVLYPKSNLIKLVNKYKK